MNVVDTTERSALAADNAEVIHLSDDRYPPLLREIHDPPDKLYVLGDPDLLQRPQLAMVGARRASAVALRLAERFAAEVVAAGLQVCSGMAQGIDGASHRGALQGGGTTVAVMGTGIDIIYPAAHRALADEIAANGCLVSEFPPGARPRRQNFPRRNRIISGLSLGVLVVEAALPSGSLITARTALEQGREVFALPWSVAHRGGAGCLSLLQDGARMVLTIDDVLGELGSLYQLQLNLQGSAPACPEVPAKEEPPLLRLLGYEEVGLDALARRSGLAVADLLAQLSALEISGAVIRGPGGYMRA